MKGRNRRFNETGQSVIMFIVLLPVFLGILALALDGGNIYATRRAAQVAADAGALAGAREICLTGDANIATDAALDYAINHNRAVTATVTVDAGQVTVETFIPFQTFIAHYFGQSNITAAGVAEAGCFSPGAGTGILPIAWSCRPPDLGGSDSEDCDLQYMEPNNTCQLGVDPMYIIVDSPTVADDTVCQDPPNSGTPAGAVDCDIDDDGIDDLDVLSGGNRSWLDLDGGGGGAGSLSDWIQNGFQDEITIHTWFAGQTGVAVSVYDTTADNRLGDIVAIPVFDQYCGGYPNSSCPGLVHPEDTIVDTGGSSTDYFHVISFSAFYVACVDAGSHGPCPVHEALNLPPNVASIEGCFVEGFLPGITGNPSGGVEGGVWTLYLTR